MSDPICLSTVSVLRCSPFTKLENELLIIPAGLEALCAIWLLASSSGRGKRNLFLVAETIVYLVLAILDLLSHIIPAAREKVQVFKIIDIVLASTSSIPILLYVVFLYFFSAATTLSELPRQAQMFSKLLLILFIPFVIASSILASFIGITHSYVLDAAGSKVLAIGFLTDQAHNLWQFFTSLNIALFTAYQMFSFIFVFYRLVLAFIDQRRIEDEGRDERRFLRGTGWISAGIKVGAIETVIAFAENSFGLAFSRRSLRFVSRALLVMGLARGVDIREDFQLVQEELRRPMQERQRQRRSGIRTLISNPRFSTFLQLSPNPTRRMSQLQVQQQRQGTLSPADSIAYLANARRDPRDRVTVHFAPDNTPSLQMRFSVLDLPSPRELVKTIQEKSIRERSLFGDPVLEAGSVPEMRYGAQAKYESSFYAGSRAATDDYDQYNAFTPTLQRTATPSLPPPIHINVYDSSSTNSAALPPHQSKFSSPTATSLSQEAAHRHTMSNSIWSVKSKDSEMVAIDELVPQFPVLPPRVSLSAAGSHGAIRETLRGIREDEEAHSAEGSTPLSLGSSADRSVTWRFARPPPVARIPHSPKSEWLETTSPSASYPSEKFSSAKTVSYSKDADADRPDSGVDILPFDLRPESSYDSRSEEDPFADADENNPQSYVDPSGMYDPRAWLARKMSAIAEEPERGTASHNASPLSAIRLSYTADSSYGGGAGTGTPTSSTTTPTSAAAAAVAALQQGYRASRKTPTIVRRGRTRGSMRVSIDPITIPPSDGFAKATGIMVIQDGGSPRSVRTSGSEYSINTSTHGGHPRVEQDGSAI